VIQFKQKHITFSVLFFGIIENNPIYLHFILNCKMENKCFKIFNKEFLKVLWKRWL